MVRENYKNWYPEDYNLMMNNYVNQVQTIQKQLSEEKKELYIDIILRQTTLSREEAEESLTIENNNYEKVIKNYLSDSSYYHNQEQLNNNNNTNEEFKSTNQKIYSEIRNFMDSVHTNIT